MGGRRGPGSWPEPGWLLEALSEPVGTGQGWRGSLLTVLVAGQWGRGKKKHSLRYWELWFNHSQINLPPAPSPHRPGCVFFLRGLHDVGRAP